MLRSEREWLRDMAAERDGGVLVNIGVLWGASLHCLRAGAPRSRIIGVDLDCSQLACNPGVELWEGDSHKLHAQCTVPVALLFVDGDHCYESVALDIEAWTPKVELGGLVAFHDYEPTAYDLTMMPELAGVRRAVDEWAADHGEIWQQVDAPGSIRAYRRVGVPTIKRKKTRKSDDG